MTQLFSAYVKIRTGWDKHGLPHHKTYNCWIVAEDYITALSRLLGYHDELIATNSEFCGTIISIDLYAKDEPLIGVTDGQT